MKTGGTAGRRGLGRIGAVVGLLAVLVSMVAGAPRAAVAQVDFDGEHILQCSCPVWWSAPWEGEGTFDANASLDEVILENGDATVMIHEIPLTGGSVEDMIEDRTVELENTRRIADLEETYADASDDEAYAGRSWVNRNDETIYSFQHAQVWEKNYLLSIEFIAPEEQFVELWGSMEDVLLVGQPILNDLDGEEVAQSIGIGGREQGRSGVDPALEDSGVIDEVTYESPNYGYELTWTEAWTVIPDNTRSERDYDQVQLISEDNWVVSFSGEVLPEDVTIVDYMDSLIASEEDSGSEILLDDADDEAGAYLAVYESDSGVEMVVYAVAMSYDRDGTAIFAFLIAPLADFEDALAETQDAFALDGEPVLDYFRARQIQRALDN